jgi:O-antigen ligase
MMADTPIAGFRRPGIVIVTGFVALLAGHYTLDRIGITAPLVNDTRVGIFAILLATFALEVTNAGGGFDSKSRSGKRCLWPILLLFSYQALSISWAPVGARVTNALGDLLAIAVLVVVYWALAEWDRDRVVQLTLGCFLAAGVVYFLVAASGRGHEPDGRWAALGGGSNVFVRIMILASIAAVYFYCRSAGRIAWLVPLPAFIAGAVASGSRGGIVAALVSVALAIPPLLPRLRAGRVLSLTITVVLMAWITWLVIGQYIAQMFQERFVAITFEQRYTSGRDVLYTHAFNLFLDKPIAGVGLDGFYAVTNGSLGQMYVHDLPLSVAAEGGLIGLILLGGTCYALRRGYAKVPRAERTIESRTAAYCGIFIAVASLFSGNYYDARLMWIFLILAAVGPPNPDPQHRESIPPARGRIAAMPPA